MQKVTPTSTNKNPGTFGQYENVGYSLTIISKLKKTLNHQLVLIDSLF